MSQLELKDLLEHLKTLGVIQAAIVTPEGLRMELVFEADPFAGMEEPKSPAGTNWS